MRSCFIAFGRAQDKESFGNMSGARSPRAATRGRDDIAMLHPRFAHRGQALLGKLGKMAHLKKTAQVEGLAHPAFLLPKMHLAQNVPPKSAIPLQSENGNRVKISFLTYLEKSLHGFFRCAK